METAATTLRVRHDAHGTGTDAKPGEIAEKHDTATTVAGGDGGGPHETMIHGAVRTAAVNMLRTGVDLLHPELSIGGTPLFIDGPHGTRYALIRWAEGVLPAWSPTEQHPPLTEMIICPPEGRPVCAVPAKAVTLVTAKGPPRRRVLVVEDDDRVIPWIEAAVCSFGHEWVRATSQTEAQTLLDQHDFSYVLLDIDIPHRPNSGGASGEYGMNLLRWIRETKPAHLHVVAMRNSGTDDLYTGWQLMSRGATDVISKPRFEGRTLESVLGCLEERMAADDRVTAGADESAGWLTVSQAAMLLMDVVSGLSLEKARARVSAAATRRAFTTNGRQRKDRLIELDSFNTWRFTQRQRDLAAADGGW